MPRDQLRIQAVVSAPLDENAYVAALPGRDDCLVVDPGMEPERIIEFLRSEGLTPAAILNTHGHFDHIAGNAALKAQWPDTPLVIGAEDAEKLTDANQNLSMSFGLPILSPPADLVVAPGETFSAAGFTLEVRHVPGHSAGHVVYLWGGSQPMVALVGDVIFAGSIGRTDFPDGDFEVLARGIRQQLYTLPDDTILLPGHGPATTVGREKRSNPFVGGVGE